MAGVAAMTVPNGFYRTRIDRFRAKLKKRKRAPTPGE